ncbi:hypothetical protein TTHERM_000590238 (macronuclear) [Tetrahymena thermophila SB210]|uniref:Uncharacterized protein n=1 Tax=Tetrahymena thermophila (strain SB210) TaxID=312017 RepID=W7XIN4_TETTS|nr:hypothetical protein TTHERM_000590238 [Tetrahymena thermophila SB210]EWS73454.1 hypothetical protein TTHERM_000590238 [Tetrahymena thermophila SB210]|eukprot:XP_012654025.1 hypothetical protein TTHERM_000590238 [Tetrahymena thermophila SB210]
MFNRLIDSQPQILQQFFKWLGIFIKGINKFQYFVWLLYQTKVIKKQINVMANLDFYEFKQYLKIKSFLIHLLIKLKNIFFCLQGQQLIWVQSYMTRFIQYLEDIITKQKFYIYFNKIYLNNQSFRFENHRIKIIIIIIIIIINNNSNNKIKIKKITITKQLFYIILEKQINNQIKTHYQLLFSQLKEAKFIIHFSHVYSLSFQFKYQQLLKRFKNLLSIFLQLI